MEGFVIKTELAGFVSWIDGFCSGGQPSRTCEILRALVFINRDFAEKNLKELRKKYPSRTFEIESAPENSRGAIAGENYWIV